MKDYIYRRVLEVAHYIYETKATVRQAAKVFGVSKSTVHKDVTDRIEKVDHELAKEVRKVLDYNKSERHYRGGEATRKKYLKERKGAEETTKEVGN
ncbi:sporulation transcriptional regulator SpoIIID [Halanaerocella petrolearia]